MCTCMHVHVYINTQNTNIHRYVYVEYPKQFLKLSGLPTVLLATAPDC